MMRNFFKSDIDAVLAIEKSVHISPWNEETFKTCFQAGHIGWVLESDKNIIGFIMVSFNLDECHILNIGVSRDYQRQGNGHKLLDYVLSQAKQKGIGIAYLEVRRSNTRAISLYQRMRFQLIGERKNYYPTVNGYEDALVYAKSLADW